jgi:hypothetical protein
MDSGELRIDGLSIKKTGYLKIESGKLKVESLSDWESKRRFENACLTERSVGYSSAL